MAQMIKTMQNFSALNIRIGEHRQMYAHCPTHAIKTGISAQYTLIITLKYLLTATRRVPWFLWTQANMKGAFHNHKLNYHHIRREPERNKYIVLVQCQKHGAVVGEFAF